MRCLVLVLCAFPLAGCSQKDGEAEPADAAKQQATAFCKQIYEAPKRHLEAQCSEADKKTDAYGAVAEMAAHPVETCVTMIEPGLAAGRLKLDEARAKACGEHLEKTSWKATLRSRNISAHEACTKLAMGSQEAGKPCRLSLECADGLRCEGASLDEDGACSPRGAVDAKCSAPSAWLFAEAEASCKEGSYCNYGGFVAPYARGYARHVPVYAARGLPSDETARQAALRDAAEMGMIGLLNTGAGGDPDAPTAPWGRDDSLGLDPLADARGLGLQGIGNLAPKDGQGFGSGHGRLGKKRSRPPRVRMGSTEVKGRLPPEVIQRIVRQNFGRFRLCYENGLRSDPKLQGRVTVRFVISEEGTVNNVSGSSDMPDQGVVSCVTKAFYALTFPQPEGGIVSVAYPIVFSPGDAPEKSKAEAGTAVDREATPDSPPGASASASAPPAAPAPPGADAALTCTASAAEGAGCRTSRQCADFLVCRAGQCDTPGKDGDRCSADLQCAEGRYCVPKGSGAGSCMKLQGAGATCQHSSECQGGCEDGKCVSLCGEG